MRQLVEGQADVVYWLVGDHASSPRSELVGTTSVVLNSDGSLHSEARHYPYGEERWRSGAVPTDYRFTGQRQIASINLVHMGARFYDASLGRWTSADTIVPDPANPQSFNRYSWVRGNPLRFADPTGHKEEGECGFWGEACHDDPPLDDPPPIEFYPPFSDEVDGTWRHLVETCGPLDCSAAVFNAYTPGAWNFHIADGWLVATSEVYRVGRVSEEEALLAGREGRPNPLATKQFEEGIRQRPNPDFPAETHLIGWVKPWLPFQYFFDSLGEELGWNDSEKFASHNFEPRYLEELMVNHQNEVGQAYTKFLWEYNKDPEGWIDKHNMFKWAGSRR
jgi:RHS repeat-associated protein